MTEQRITHAPTVLTIAGFDPSAGAGVIADVRTLIALGCAPAAAVTSLTFQNAQGVRGAEHQSANTVSEQIRSVISGTTVAAVKTGMLPTAEIVHTLAVCFRDLILPAPVVDPVLMSTSGYQLMESEAIETLVKELMPHARVVTPNIPEAEHLTGTRIGDEEGMRNAAQRLRQMGARAVLIKGGHLRELSRVGDRAPEKAVIDVLDDDGRVTIFRGDWIDAPPVRGTGCMLSAAMAACLAKGMDLAAAVRAAREFVAAAIRSASQQRSPEAELSLQSTPSPS